MRRMNLRKKLLILVGVAAAAVLVYGYPPVHRRLSWRVDFALTYLRAVIHPAGEVPKPLPPPAVAVTSMPTATPSIVPTAAITPGATPTLSPTPTPLPASVSLSAPAWERQDANNCGPASLAMYLRFYGWEGDQYDISNLLKPRRQDRNVNVEELVYYVRNHAGWLNVEYRVGGDLELLERLLAAGFPVMIEESFYFEGPYWPNDDLWAAHYNLLTGYDQVTQEFTGQDSYRGPNQVVSYQTLDEYWQAFNRVYVLIYPSNLRDTVISILGPDWDADANRQNALGTARAETQADPENAFTWFNLGSNLVYFERYAEAATAYDKARELGLPQRMLRYQFGPFFAYFHSGRMEDLMVLTKYALQRTPNAEEALLWRGWGLYRQGDTPGAIADFQSALAENPNYQDARYALDFVRDNP